MTHAPVRCLLPGLVMLMLPATVAAQLPERPYYGPYSVYGPGLTHTPRADYLGPLAVRPFATTTIGIQTSVRVPEDSTVVVGGLNSFREGRNEFGTPVLGKVPIVGRPFRNVGYGYAIQRSTVTARARVIDLAEMDARILQGGR